MDVHVNILAHIRKCSGEDYSQRDGKNKEKQRYKLLGYKRRVVCVCVVFWSERKREHCISKAESEMKAWRSTNTKRMMEEIKKRKKGQEATGIQHAAV